MLGRKRARSREKILGEPGGWGPGRRDSTIGKRKAMEKKLAEGVEVELGLILVEMRGTLWIFFLKDYFITLFYWYIPGTFLALGAVWNPV